MGNDPVNSIDPDGAYSKFGAWWRNGFSMSGVYEDGGEWGFNTLSDQGGIVPHFGDEGIWRPENSQAILDAAWKGTGFAAQTPYDQMMARGGDGIEFDALGQLSLGFLAADVIALTARGGAAVAANTTPKYLYHYTSKAASQNISKVGLSTEYSADGFIYLTNKANLSPIQAQIELALPANRALPTSILRINASKLNPSIIRRVQGNLSGMDAGGGKEFLFNHNIPANLIKIIK